MCVVPAGMASTHWYVERSTLALPVRIALRRPSRGDDCVRIDVLLEVGVNEVNEVNGVDWRDICDATIHVAGKEIREESSR